ncbi:LysM peptidoglycan-binding domain-containing protein [Skermania piniformis]|uniref:LysM peptidoglycan-binding domain-containing protein n=1 Tax=Skermania pinensis TaxID=39122 RepID=A0ABX8SBD7_9ACTN|nr:LysM peptidoglycan-binding domain-containing protein [Skermania piniformis]QXQ15174.1 LysM peptidoglycan-binding domain-containing protein [Skermania piniformis]
MTSALSEYPAVRSVSTPLRRRVDRGVEVRRRPVGAPPGYRDVTAGRSTAAHPVSERSQRGAPGAAATAAAALLAAVVVSGLFGLAQFRATPAAPAVVPTSVARVQAGESLSDVAVRVAPGLAVSDAVRRIMDLNDLSGVSVQAGQTLVVPSVGSR